MIRIYFNLILVLSLIIYLGNCDEDLNSDLKCLDSKTHKPKPSVNELFGHCKKWESLSCCEKETTETFHQGENYLGFNYDHCGVVSDKCRNYFLQELCLYECDPYLGNWIVGETSKKMRKERFYEVPLCYADCKNWFDACKYDYTCRDNWHRGFKWINGTNYCNDHEKCDTFENKFKTAENFCTQIWDEAFKVDKNETNCVSFEFDKNQPNPNKRVAQFYSQANNAQAIKYSLNIYLLTVVFSFLNLTF